MKIEFNTDKTINGDERQQEYFTTQIIKDLHKYESHITKIEVHLSDQNGNKEGWDDILCVLDAKIDGIEPVVVRKQANTIALAVSGAVDKLKASLETVLGRLQNHHQKNDDEQ